MDKEKCKCDETCTCGCQEGTECTCEDNCTGNCSDETCNCVDDKECSCGNCECHESKQDDKKKHKKDKKEDKIKELENRLLEAENNFLLSKAELVNYRKRKDDEVIKMLKYAKEDLVKEMLPIMDTFERAIKMDDENLDDEVSKFLSGFKMMYCNLVSILESYGGKAIDGNNKPFDPAYHQAVMTEKKDGIEQGMVLEVLQQGYLLKDKVIRPAMVKVRE